MYKNITKYVRSIIDLLSYYKKLVPNVSPVAASLTNLKGNICPDKVIWTEDCQSTLSTLQKVLFF